MSSAFIIISNWNCYFVVSNAWLFACFCIYMFETSHSLLKSSPFVSLVIWLASLLGNGMHLLELLLLSNHGLLVTYAVIHWSSSNLWRFRDAAHRIVRNRKVANPCWTISRSQATHMVGTSPIRALIERIFDQSTAASVWILRLIESRFNGVFYKDKTRHILLRSVWHGLVFVQSWVC